MVDNKTYSANNNSTLDELIEIAKSEGYITDAMPQDERDRKIAAMKEAMNRKQGARQILSGTYKIKDVRNRFSPYKDKDDVLKASWSVLIYFEDGKGGELEDTLNLGRAFRSIGFTPAGATEPTWTPWLGGDEATVTELQTIFRGTPVEKVEKAKARGLIGKTLKVTWVKCSNDLYPSGDQRLEVAFIG